MRHGRWHGHLLLKGLRTKHAAIAVLLSTTALLAGCPMKETVGSDTPPAAFGTLQTRTGCPQLSGVYAWPPVEGRAFGYRENGSRAEGYTGGFLLLAMGPDALLWILPPDAKARRVTLKGRVPGPGFDALLRQHPDGWEPKFHGFDCSQGWMRLARDYNTGIQTAGGGTEEARLTTTEDGALLVGQKVVMPQPAATVGWGDVTFFSIPRGDRIVWTWAKLARAGASGDAFPADAVLRSLPKHR